jgi:DNA topoisomerase-6 subunit A
MLLEKTKKRTLNANSVRTFAQTLRMMGLSYQLVKTNDIATKREAYYTAYNWLEARFKNQPESDEVMDDLEAMLAVNREQIGFIPEERGGAVAGELIVVDRDSETKEKLLIDCTKMGTGAYSIPSSVEHLSFETNASFVLAIETSGLFQRLVKHKYWKTSNCILISMNGVPTRATRRFVRKLSDEKNLPVYVFTDGDFYGFMNIYRTLKVGSGNAAHINEFFCVPKARFIGVTPQDIIDYDLPTHALKEVDVKRGKDALKNDPFVHFYKEWQDAISLQLKMGKRAEQQAFAKYDLNFVITNYLPKKLADQKTWLP